MNEKLLHHPNSTQFSVLQLLINLCLFMGLACFTLSLFMPVFFTSSEDIFGYWVLIIGWIGGVFIQFAWYANPVQLLAFLLARNKPKIALLLSCLALLLATGSFWFFEIPTGINHEKIFITEFGLGLYIWYAAHIFFLCALISRFIQHAINR